MASAIVNPDQHGGTVIWAHEEAGVRLTQLNVAAGRGFTMLVPAAAVPELRGFLEAWERVNRVPKKGEG